MPLVDYCVRDAILSEMEAGDKEDALRQLVEALAAAKAIPKAKANLIRNEIIERERQATTGIGKGVGIPHARSAHAKRLVIAIGRIPEGIQFGAVDGERVRVIMLLVSPQDHTEEHLAAMKSIVKIVRDPYQCKRLHGCRTPDSFVDLIAELDGPAR
jgi:mannitol/fructose-specific phosphotransferase system IIA component (Ntr-type)